MATVALIPSVLGLRPSFYAFADALRDNLEDVRILDVFDGGARDSYDEGLQLVEKIGYPELMTRAKTHAKELPSGFVPIGFSLGAGVAQYLATEVSVRGAVLIAGAQPMTDWAKPWPKGIPAQIHVKEQDEFCTREEVAQAMNAIEEAGGHAELFVYPGSGHLFNDRDLPGEYDAEATDLLVERTIAFLDRLG